MNNLDFGSSINIKAVCASTLLSGATTCGITVCGVNVCASNCFIGSGAGLTGTGSTFTAKNTCCFGGQLPVYYAPSTSTITGATNGLSVINKQTKLGGALTGNTTLTGAYTLNICSGAKLNTVCGYQISGATIFDIGRANLNSLQIGCNASSKSAHAIAIGSSACANNVNAIAIGVSSYSSGATSSIAIGIGSYATGQHTIAIGCGATAKGSQSIAMGCFVSVTGNTTVAIGSNMIPIGSSNTLVGYAANASSQGTALGYGANAGFQQTTALGYSACATGGQYSLAVGVNANALAGGAVAIGTVNACGTYSISIGNVATSCNNYAIAIGSQACANGYAALGIGRNMWACGGYSVALGNCGCATNGGIAIGFQACSTGSSAIAIGSGTKACGTSSLAIGYQANANNATGTAVGPSTTAGSSSTAVGYLATATGYTATALGYYSIACGQGSVALGYLAKTTGVYSVAIAQSACATADCSMAFGLNSCAVAVNAIALGTANKACAQCSNILGGCANTICSGNVCSTLVGGINIILTGSSFANYVVVPNLAIYCTPAGSGSVLCWNSITKKVDLTTAGSSNLVWTGSTANGVGTYSDATHICSQPNMTFNGTCLNVTGCICTSSKFIENGTCLASTYLPFTLTTDWQDPTGFVDGSNITVSYSWSQRKITLTGNLDYYWNGVKKTLTSPWTSSAHTATVGTWYLYSADGTNIAWSQSVWSFNQMMVALVNYKSTSGTTFAIRETHGMMPWSTHQDLHKNIGTYLYSGGQASSWTANTATDSANSPNFGSAVVADEDNQTNIATLTKGSYTLMRVSGATSIYTLGSATPFSGATNSFIRVNDPTTGGWTAGINARYYNVYQFLLPTTSDVTSQKFRTIFVQPQATFTSLASAQAEDTRGISLGSLAGESMEFVPYARITYLTANGNNNYGKVTIPTGGITYIVGSRMGATSVSGVVAPGNHANLSNLTWANSGHLGTNDTLAAFDATGNACNKPISDLMSWAGSTANGVGTYVSACCACSNPNMTFNGSSLAVTGNVKASTYVCSPTITGSTKVCSPIIIGTSCVCSPIVLGSTCVCGAIICASTCFVGVGTAGGLCLGATNGTPPTYGGTIVVRAGSATAGPEQTGGIELVQADVNSGYGLKIYTNSSSDTTGLATRHNTATWTPRLAICTTTGTVIACGIMCATTCFVGSGAGLTGTASSLTVGSATNSTNSTCLNGIPACYYVYGCGCLGSCTATAGTYNPYEPPMYRSGFFEITGAAWTPTTDWYWGLTAAHTSNGPAYNYSMNLIGAGTGSAAGCDFYLRSVGGGTPMPWRKIITDQSIGSQSVNNAVCANGQCFCYSNISNGPTYVWGTNSTGLAFLAATSYLSVSYASTAGSAPANGGSANYATCAGGVNIYSSNEVILDCGFAGGVLYMNYRGSSGAITSIIMSNGIGNGGLACVCAVDFIATSDCRIKTCITPICNALSTVTHLRGVNYQECNDETHTNRIGLIAQDVQKVLPEVVTIGAPDDKDTLYGITDGRMGITYDKITAVLIEAIKELDKKVNCLCCELNYWRNYNTPNTR